MSAARIVPILADLARRPACRDKNLLLFDWCSIHLPGRRDYTPAVSRDYIRWADRHDVDVEAMVDLIRSLPNPLAGWLHHHEEAHAFLDVGIDALGKAKVLGYMTPLNAILLPMLLLHEKDRTRVLLAFFSGLHEGQTTVRDVEIGTMIPVPVLPDWVEPTLTRFNITPSAFSTHSGIPSNVWHLDDGWAALVVSNDTLYWEMDDVSTIVVGPSHLEHLIINVDLHIRQQWRG